MDGSARYGYGWWWARASGSPRQSTMDPFPVSPITARPADDDILVIILSNDDGNLNRIEHLAVGIAGTTLGKPYQPPVPFPLPEPELGRLAGTYAYP